MIESSLINHQDRLMRLALHYTKDLHNAEDLVQEVFLKALQNKEKFDGKNLQGWLSTILYNSFINNVRKQKRNTTFNVGDDFEQDKIQPDGHKLDGSRILYEKELWQTINQLPSRQREAFTLHYIGYKYEEISEMLNTSLGGIKSTIFYAKKRLQSRLSR